MFFWVLGLRVMPTVGALCWMLPKMRVPWVMYGVVCRRCRRWLRMLPLVRVLLVAFRF